MLILILNLLPHVIYRQYYVATAANKPKDVVVAVDVSGVTATRSNYNSKTLLIVAREAVQYVIDTLNPNDRVGKMDILKVVFFSFNY